MALSEIARLSRRLSARRPAVIQEPDSISTAVAAILAPGEGGAELLLIRRAERAGDPWSGHMGLPGGRREPGDADLLETALRETREEIGVDLPKSALVGTLDDLHPRSPTLPKVVIRPYVFALEKRPDARPSAEVAQVCWIKLADLPASAGRAAVKIMDGYVEVPCFRCAGLPDGLVVWGLTFRILTGLLPAA